MVKKEPEDLVLGYPYNASAQAEGTACEDCGGDGIYKWKATPSDSVTFLNGEDNKSIATLIRKDVSQKVNLRCDYKGTEQCGPTSGSEEGCCTSCPADGCSYVETSFNITKSSISGPDSFCIHKEGDYLLTVEPTDTDYFVEDISLHGPLENLNTLTSEVRCIPTGERGGTGYLSFHCKLNNGGNTFMTSTKEFDVIEIEEAKCNNPEGVRCIHLDLEAVTFLPNKKPKDFKWTGVGDAPDPADNLVVSVTAPKGGLFTFKATCCDEDDGKEVSVDVVEVKEIEVTDAHEDGGEYYFLLGNNTSQTFTLKAITNPANQCPKEFFWEADPTTGVAITSKNDLTTTVTATAPGKYKFKANCCAKCTNPPQVIVNVFTFDYITPAGNPVSSPTTSGLGQNEFTFSPTVPTGTLTMNLVIEVNPAGVASHIADLCNFEVDPIGNSVLSWSSSHTGGVPTVNGDNLEATVTFTGLPVNNTDFGLKITRLYYEGKSELYEDYEVFYTATSSNHPGGVAGNPNWFYYWSEISGRDDLNYGGVKIFNGKVYYGEYYSSSDSIKIYNAVVTNNNMTGPKGVAGIDCYGQTVCHERKHQYQYHTGLTNFGLTYIDSDNDFLSDYYEGLIGTNPLMSDTDSDGISDAEEDAIVDEFLWPNMSQDSQDWSNTGRNY